MKLYLENIQQIDYTVFDKTFEPDVCSDISVVDLLKGNIETRIGMYVLLEKLLENSEEYSIRSLMHRLLERDSFIEKYLKRELAFEFK